MIDNVYLKRENVTKLIFLGFIICSDRQSVKNCFRIGSMGDISPDDVKDLVFNVRHICNEMRLPVPLQEPEF